MSSDKSSNFVSLYKMQFYKRRESWIETSKINVKPNTQHPLNMTFDVEDGSASNLNDGFIDTDSDTDNTPQTQMESLKKVSLTQQWMESIDIVPSGIHSTDDSSDILQRLLSRNNPELYRQGVFVNDILDHNLCSGSVREGSAKVTGLPKRDEIRPWSLNTATTKSVLTKGVRKRLEDLQQAQYAVNSGIDWLTYTPEPYSAPFILPEVGKDTPDCPEEQVHDDISMEDVEMDGAIARDVLYSIISTLENQFNLIKEEMKNRSIDSYSEFSRGAHLTAHASELELSTLNNEVLDADLVTRMSGPQLSAALQTQMYQLALLMWEKVTRQRLESQSVYGRMREEFPTRDVGPSTSDSDFIAGSFLQPSREDRVVIKGGRPVRLHGDFI